MDGLFGPSSTERDFQSQATFKMLRRLHGHNLENQGLNNLSEAFQSFVTRAKFFSIGKLRRTWSHSAVEFMKYRRLLPMIVGDEHDPGSVFDEFIDIGRDGLPCIARTEVAPDERRICVNNASSRATKSQLQSFFSKFGKIQSCHIPSEKAHHDAGLYATLPKKKRHGACIITFKNAQSAMKSRKAPPEELVFYGEQMHVGPYVPSGGRRRTTSIQMTKFSEPDQREGIDFAVGGGQLSRTSSVTSLASTGTTCSCSTLTGPFMGLPLDELPDRALILVLYYVGPINRIRMERVNKRWLEAAAKAWAECRNLPLGEELNLTAFKPLSHVPLRAILRRCGPHLHSLSLAGIKQLLDEKTINDIGAFCPNLIELDLSGIVVSPENLRALTESTPKLAKVAYRNMAQTSERAFWSMFKAIAAKIRALDLRGCTRLRGTFLRAFGTELEEILLDGCALLDENVVEDICTRCTCIRTLKLDGCRKLTDASLSLISRHLPELSTLTLCGEFPNFSTDGMAQLARISSLRCLSLDYNPAVDDNLLVTLARGLAELRQFSLAFAGSDKSISAVGLVELAKLGRLEEIDLSGLAALNGQVLKEICAGCPELRKLVLRGCSYLGNQGVEELGKLNKLEHADLSGCILVSNEPVQKICRSLTIEDSEQTSQYHPICLTIGGTICEPHKIRLPRHSRVFLDQSDNSALCFQHLAWFRGQVDVLDDEEEDDFTILSAHRDFIAGALQTEEEPFPMDDPKSIVEWAQKEAAELGLLGQDGK